eukprot:345140-Chlamydomonas_euryale.AAC.9
MISTTWLTVRTARESRLTYLGRDEGVGGKGVRAGEWGMFDRQKQVGRGTASSAASTPPPLTPPSLTPPFLTPHPGHEI